MYVNVGARYTEDECDIPTKSGLKGTLKTDRTLVTFYVTDAFGENVGKVLRGDDLDIGVKYSVTGPNPYNNRKWYATVEKRADGTITVK